MGDDILNTARSMLARADEILTGPTGVEIWHVVERLIERAERSDRAIAVVTAERDAMGRALADMLHPLAPWPPGWAPFWRECAILVGPDGLPRAYAWPSDDGAMWRIPAASALDEVEGHARDVLTAIADCMARLEVTRG